MRLRVRRFWLSAVVGLFWAWAWSGGSGCGDDSGGLPSSERKTLCQKTCTKQVQCGKEDDQAKCETSCNSITEHMIGDAVRALADCWSSHSCDELDNGVCDEAGKDKCTSNDSVVDSALCDRGVACGLWSTKQECLADMQDQSEDSWFTKCFLQSDLDGYANCIGTVSCDSFYDGVENCAAQHLGLVAEEEPPPSDQ